MFGAGGPYVMVPIALIIGVFLPLPFYFMHKKWPKAGWDWVITPVRANDSFEV